MVLIRPKEDIIQKDFLSLFVMVLLSIIMTGTAFAAGFLFQNLILDCLKRCHIYDENGKVVPCSMKYLAITHLVCIILISFLVAIGYQLLKRW